MFERTRTQTANVLDFLSIVWLDFETHSHVNGHLCENFTVIMSCYCTQVHLGTGLCGHGEGNPRPCWSAWGHRREPADFCISGPAHAHFWTEAGEKEGKFAVMMTAQWRLLERAVIIIVMIIIIIIIMSLFLLILECLSMWNRLSCAEQVQIQKYKTHAYNFYKTLKTVGAQIIMLKHPAKHHAPGPPLRNFLFFFH